MNKLIIEFSHPDIMKPKPWPVAIDLETGRAISGLGNDDGALLIGFGVQGKQSVDVWFESGQEFSTDLIKGLVPTFSNNGGFFEWGNPIRDARVQEPVTDPVFTLSIALRNAAMLTPNDIAGALERLASDMRNRTAGDPHEEIHKVPASTTIAGNVRDANGQQVGHWNIKEVAR